MKMKRYIAITLLLCLLVALTACGTPEPAASTPSKTIDSTTTVPATTISSDPQLLTFPYDSGELTEEVIRELIMDAIEILDHNDVFRLENNFYLESRLQNSNRADDVFYGVVSIDTNPDMAKRSRDEVAKNAGYITVQSSSDDETRFHQIYLLLLAMVCQRYSDAIIDAYPVDGSYYSSLLLVSTDYRKSDISEREFLSVFRKDDSVDKGNSFVFPYGMLPFVLPSDSTADIYSPILRSLEVPTFDYYSRFADCLPTVPNVSGEPLPEGPTLYAFDIENRDMTYEILKEKIRDSIEIIDANQEIRIHRTFYVSQFVNYICNENEAKDFGVKVDKTGKYFVIQKAKDAETRYLQIYILLLEMLFEQYRDILLMPNIYLPEPPLYDNFVYISSGYRTSRYLSPDHYFDCASDELIWNDGIAIVIKWDYPRIHLNRSKENVFNEILESLSEPVFHSP